MDKNKDKSKDKEFKYLTGSSIYQNRASLTQIKDREEYTEFHGRLNRFWDHNSVEGQLINKGFAVITSLCHSTSERWNLFRYKQLKNKALSSEDLENAFQIGENPYLEMVYMSNDKYSNLTSIAFRDAFKLDLEYFDRFCKENSFYWNIGLIITETGRRSLLNASSCIYQYKFVLYIACDEDDTTVTSIKFGLENLGSIEKAPERVRLLKALSHHFGSIEKAPKRVRLLRALSYHFGSIDFDPQLVSAMTAWVICCIIAVVCILRVAAMGAGIQ